MSVRRANESGPRWGRPPLRGGYRLCVLWLAIASGCDEESAGAADSGTEVDLDDVVAVDLEDEAADEPSDVVEDEPDSPPDLDSDAADGPTDPADTPSEDLADAVADRDVAVEPDAAERDATDPDEPDRVDTSADPVEEDDAPGELGADADVADVEAEADIETRTCDEIVASIESERGGAIECERSSQCAVRANPLCPFGGCFTFFRAGFDLTRLRTDEAIFLADCGRNSCACPPNEPSVLACIDGACGPCPIDCPYTCALDCPCFEDACGCEQPVCADGSPESCSALSAAAAEALEDLSACVVDTDCTPLALDACPLVPCGVGIHRQASAAQLEALLEGFAETGCGTLEPCACPAPAPLACVDGRCVAADP